MEQKKACRGRRMCPHEEGMRRIRQRAAGVECIREEGMPQASAKKACYAADDECVGEEGMRSQMWLRDVQLLQMLLAEKYGWSG